MCRRYELDYPLNIEDLTPEERQLLDEAVRLEQNPWWRLGNWWDMTTLRIRWWFESVLRRAH